MSNVRPVYSLATALSEQKRLCFYCDLILTKLRHSVSLMAPLKSVLFRTSGSEIARGPPFGAWFGALGRHAALPLTSPPPGHRRRTPGRIGRNGCSAQTTPSEGCGSRPTAKEIARCDIAQRLSERLSFRPLISAGAWTIQSSDFRNVLTPYLRDNWLSNRVFKVFIRLRPRLFESFGEGGGLTDLGALDRCFT